jgi:ABC-type uncharacterized transport system involved in gliding motility auxiliary subunit
VEIKTANRTRLVKTGTLSAGVLLSLALFLIVNYFGWKYYKRFDWTSNHLYSLSEKTLNVLKDLKTDINFVVLVPLEQNTYEPTRELLARYGAASSHVHVRFADPEKNPLETAQLARQYGVNTASVVVLRGNDRRIIDSADLAELDYSGLRFGQQQPEMTGFKGEQLFTGAILQLAEGRKPKILFTSGHGEHSLDDQQAGGMSGAQDLLGRDNFVMEEWASLGKSVVPQGTDLVVIAGPTSSFLPPELSALRAFLNAGGRMLVLLDPTLGPAGANHLVETGLSAFLAQDGVKIDEDIVLDPTNGLPMFGAEYLFAREYGDHPITKPLRTASLPVLVRLARSVSKGNAPAGTEVTDLIRTSTQGWGATDLAHLDNVQRSAKDVQGPVSLGVAVERKAAPGGRDERLVVFGDSDFATNQLLKANAPNTILLSNSLNWLVERSALLAIPPRKTEQVHLSLTKQQLNSIYLTVLVLMPGLAIIAGVYVYFLRRR